MSNNRERGRVVFIGQSDDFVPIALLIPNLGRRWRSIAALGICLIDRTSRRFYVFAGAGNASEGDVGHVRIRAQSETRCSLAQVVYERERDNLTPDGLIGLLSSVSCGAFVLTTDQTVVFWNDRAHEILGYRPERIVGRRGSSVAGGTAGVALSEGCADGCAMMRSLRDGQMPGRGRLRMRCSWGEQKWLVVTPMAVSGVEQSGPLLVYLFGDSGEEAPAAAVDRLVELGGGGGRGSDQIRYERPTTFLADPRDRVTEGDDGDQLCKMYEALTEAAGSDRIRQDAEFRESPEDLENRIGGANLRGSGAQSGEVAESRGGQPGEAEAREVRLTDRQREVLSYLALGWETKYIAEELGVSWYTVRKHIENLRGRLGASNRLDAVVIAMRLGIIPSD